MAYFNSIAQIKAAVDLGLNVKVSNLGYSVRVDTLGQYLITFDSNGYTIGLTNRAGDTLNAPLAEFFIAPLESGK